MDPTAPENNDQNTQNPQAPSPVQPGQFVVVQEENSGAPQVQNQAPQQDMGAYAQQAQAPDMPAIPGDPYQQATPPAFTANSYQDNMAQAQGPAPAPAMPPPPPAQPNPTPFAPPAPAQPPTGGSKSGLVKIIGIAVGVIALIVIIAALIWYFLLNKKTEPTAATNSQDETQESSPASKPAGGFGQIPESTAPAQPTDLPSTQPDVTQQQPTTPAVPPAK